MLYVALRLTLDGDMPVIVIIRESVDRFGTKFQNTGPTEYSTISYLLE
jgi:hypothetical protein